MRRFVVLVGAASAGALAWSLVRARGPARPGLVTGIFSNGMAYARLGTGSKSLLAIPGGPGNQAPGGIMTRMVARPFRPFIDAGYSVWLVARKRGMPTGHTTADMAADYADLISEEFGGRVDLLLGMSYGGVIGLFLAARHPDRFSHIAIGVAGYDAREDIKSLDYECAKLLSEGRRGDAGALMLGHMAPRLRVPGVSRILGAGLVRVMYGKTHPYFASDIMVEAEAEMKFDVREVLADISVPVLLVCGDKDEAIPKEIYEETARLIPDCTLRMYEGAGHMGAVFDPRFARDVLDFVARHPRINREEAVSEPVLASA